MIKVNIPSKFLLCQFKWVSINEKYTELVISSTLSHTTCVLCPYCHLHFYLEILPLGVSVFVWRFILLLLLRGFFLLFFFFKSRSHLVSPVGLEHAGILSPQCPKCVGI